MTLSQLKSFLKDSWVPGFGYDSDETFYVCYSDGSCLDTRESDSRLPLRGIIGISFFGSCSQFFAGYEIFNGKKVLLS